MITSCLGLDLASHGWSVSLVPMINAPAGIKRISIWGRVLGTYCLWQADSRTAGIIRAEAAAKPRDIIIRCAFRRRICRGEKPPFLSAAINAIILSVTLIEFKHFPAGEAQFAGLKLKRMARKNRMLHLLRTTISL